MGPHRTYADRLPTARTPAVVIPTDCFSGASVDCVRACETSSLQEQEHSGDEKRREKRWPGNMLALFAAAIQQRLYPPATTT